MGYHNGGIIVKHLEKKKIVVIAKRNIQDVAGKGSVMVATILVVRL